MSLGLFSNYDVLTSVLTEHSDHYFDERVLIFFLFLKSTAKLVV